MPAGRVQIFSWFIVLLPLIFQCRSSVKPDEGGFVDRDGDTINLGSGDDDKIPPFLWSPSQRKINSAYYFLAAEYMNLSGEITSATDLLEQAYNLDPNPFVGGKLIASKAQTQNPSTLLEDARRMVLLYPKFYRLRLYYAQILARSGRVADAIVSLEEGLRLNADDEQMYLELIEIYQRQRTPMKALVIAKDLVRHIPGSATGWLVLAKLYVVTSQKEDALKAADRAYELQSSNPETILVYALALELNDQSPKAIALYEQLYRLNPANEELLGRMVELYRQLGDLNVALELLDELAELTEGKRPGIQIQRAIILWELKRNQEAAIILDKLAKDYPESERIGYLAGLGFEKLQEFTKAIKYYELVPLDASLRLEADFRRAVIYKALENYKKSSEIIEAAIEKEGASWEYFALAADVRAADMNFENAVALVKKGYTKFPEKHRLLFLRGVYQEKSGDIDSCIATMRQVIKVEPTNSSALNYLGYLFAERSQNLPEAIRLIRQAINLKPNDPYYLDSLGWALFQQGNLVEAEATLMAALALAPEEGVVLEHLAEVALKKNNRDKAKAMYVKAISTKLEKRDRDRIEARYEELFGKT